MKKQILALAILASCSVPFHGTAQVHVSVNLGVQPLWGPVGYDHADYYYFPDAELYYSVSRQQYTYFDGGRWITTAYLPPRYHDFDLYHSYKAVINEPNPWMHHDRFKAQYAQFAGRHDQPVIRESHETKYFANPNHPEHNHWHGNQPAPGRPADHHDKGERHDEHGR